MEHAAVPLKNLLIFLVAAGVVVPLFHRARLGAVLSFLLFGMVVGPLGLGRLVPDYPSLKWVTADEGPVVLLMAELGVVFLLFMIGLDLSLRRLWELRRFVAGVGGLQFVLTAAALSLAIAAAGVPLEASIILGLCLAMSSTAIVMQLLEEQGRSATAVGRIAIAVLLFQDLMVAPVLFGTQTLIRGGDIVSGFLSALFWAAVAIAGIVGSGYYLLRPLLRLAAHTGSREILIAITMLIVISAAWTTGHFGLSTALGAFLAGLLFSETEFAHQIEVDIAPLKSMFLSIFFVTVGMSIDVVEMWKQIHLIVAAVLALLVIKAVVLYVSARIMRVPRPVAAETAVLLPQGGEFAFVVIGLATVSRLIEPDVGQFATVVAGISMMVTPLCALFGARLGKWLDRKDADADMPDVATQALRDHVVIGGFGRVGQTLARMLDRENIPYAAFDTSGELVTRTRKGQANVYLGDASRGELIERLGAKAARAFVVTVDEPKAAERMVKLVREINPDVPVFARAIDPEHALTLLQLGAVGVIPEAVEASLQLSARVLESLGLPEEAVEHRIEHARREELERLSAGHGKL